MTHLYTRGCEYALRALQVMVGDTGRARTVVELCDTADIPEQFTRKMLQQLVRAGILNSIRGPGGGFRFARDPNEISLMDIVAAIEDGTRLDRCILGHKECEDSDPCPLHHKWSPIKNSANSMLENMSVSDLGKKPRKARKKAKRSKARSRRR